jgi:molybdopterin converting factor small subunit
MTGDITVRYFAGAAEAAGTVTETFPATTVAGLTAAMVARHGAALAAVLPRCSLLAGGRRADDPALALPGGSVVDVLPPFAGG